MNTIKRFLFGTPRQQRGLAVTHPWLCGLVAYQPSTWLRLNIAMDGSNTRSNAIGRVLEYRKAYPNNAACLGCDSTTVNSLRGFCTWTCERDTWERSQAA